MIVKTGTQPRAASPQVHVFSTPIGWMAVQACRRGIHRISVGHSTPSSIRRRINSTGALVDEFDAGNPGAELVSRLEAYAHGQPVDFDDIPLVNMPTTTFARRVLNYCRRIPRGNVVSYGELARRAGSPNAARAVGQVMAANRWPIVIPCHRVVGSNRRLVGFSAPQGIEFKQRLLDLEMAKGMAGTSDHPSPCSLALGPIG